MPKSYITKFTNAPIVLFLIGAVSLFGPRTANCQTVIFAENFDTLQAGPYTDADLDADFGEPRFNNGVTEGRVRVVSGSQAFGGTGSALATSYPAGVHGTRETGAQWPYEFGESYEEATLSYRVRFGPGFDFVRGGKLPGLAGGTAPTGSTQATGFNGWAGRLMWRTNFNGVSGQPQQLTSGGITYAKHTDSGFSGDGRQEDRNFFFNPDGSQTEFVSNQWYQITQRIVMNTPGEFNGIQQIWIDGVLVINEQDIRYRLDDSFAIDQLYFSTFYGGNRDWRTSKDEEAFFDDFVITIPDGNSGGGPTDNGPTDNGPTDGGFDGPVSVPGQFETLAAALAACSDGDVIELTGDVTENVTIDKSVVIEGLANAKIIAANDGVDTVTIEASYVVLAGLEIEGGRRGVHVDNGSQNVVLENLFVHNTGNVGVLVESGCNGFTMKNSEIRNCNNDGVRILSDQVVLEGNNSHRNQGNGYRLVNTDTATFDSNRAYLNNIHGFRIAGSNFHFTGNASLNSRLRGFAVEGHAHMLVDNLARSNGSHGFSIDGATDCVLFDDRARFNGGHGYRVRTSTGNQLDDLNSTGNDGHGILMLMCADNSIVNSFVFKNERSGVLLNNSTMGNTVSDNVIRSNLGSGIANFGQNTIGSNIVRDNLGD
jgi:nitrous oxidase accessory protein NosD